MECPVCCESYTKAVRKRTECPYCHYAACRPCTAKYLLESCIDAKCMNCGKAWNTEMLQASFTRTWMLNDWRIHVSKRLLDQQKSMLAETQETRLPGFRMWESAGKRVDEINLRIAELYKVLGKQMSERDSLQRLRTNLQATGFLSSERDAGGGSERSRGARFYFACPSETCRGLVGASGQCGTCGLRTCKKCRAPVPEGAADADADADAAAAHECDPEALATAELLKKDTKPCPHCHVPVYRTSGCMQMWCTHCNKAFDWASGKPIYANIHNPHYFEFLARQAEQGRIDDYGNRVMAADMECDGEDALRIPNSLLLSSAARRAISFGVPNRALDIYWTVVQRISHVNNYVLGAHRAKIEWARRDRWMDRINFLLGRLSEARFAEMLWADEKQMQKSVEYCQLLETYLHVVAPRVTLIVRQLNSPSAQGYTIEPFRELAELSQAALSFCDDGIRGLNKRYNSSLSTLTAQTRSDPPWPFGSQSV